MCTSKMSQYIIYKMLPFSPEEIRIANVILYQQWRAYNDLSGRLPILYLDEKKMIVKHIIPKKKYYSCKNIITHLDHISRLIGCYIEPPKYRDNLCNSHPLMAQLINIILSGETHTYVYSDRKRHISNVVPL